jgi:hypothetical protein
MYKLNDGARTSKMHLAAELRDAVAKEQKKGTFSQ